MGLIEKLEIQVSNVRFTNDVVQLHFRGVDEQGQINLSGYVVAEEEEYFQNASRPAMSELVKLKVVDRIEKDIEDPTEE